MTNPFGILSRAASDATSESHSNASTTPPLPKVTMASPRHANATVHSNSTAKPAFRRLSSAYYPKMPLPPLPKSATASSPQANPTISSNNTARSNTRRLSSAYYPKLPSQKPIMGAIKEQEEQEDPRLGPESQAAPEETAGHTYHDPDITTIHICTMPINNDSKVHYFNISRSLLCASSEKAQAYFYPPLGHPVDMSRFIIRAWSLAPVLVYLAWVQYRKPTLLQDGGRVSHWGDEDLSYYRLVDLWNFGIYIQDRDFRDAVIDAIQLRAEIVQTEVLPGTWTIDNAYFFLQWNPVKWEWDRPTQVFEQHKLPRPRGSLHCLLENIFATVPVERRGKDWQYAMVTGPTELRDGVLRRLAEMSEGRKFVGDVGCEFHEHLAGMWCPKRAVELAEENERQESETGTEPSEILGGGVVRFMESAEEDAKQRTDSVAVDVKKETPSLIKQLNELML
ncbi:Hypothetical predicted protein [Lecanosticta acicola]|uniref:Uncharacterized protein n=1 Tax=Lecanosticta acicola TaxID=111012 RepID=A0AAI8Z4J6_9PEZI|nr:Hypothetical predicted protein [Lecanosticta acicola]